MKILKNKLLLAVIIALTMIVTAVPVFAEPNEYTYAFNLQMGGDNSYLSPGDSKFRQTYNTSNTWMVNMKTICQADPYGDATYWLARNGDHGQVSKAHTIDAGTGKHHYNAYASASQTQVVLAADNNDNVACRVTGVWDEETN